MFLLLVAVYASIEMRVFFDKGTDIRNAFKLWHFMLGLNVWVWVWVWVWVVVRILTRLRQPNSSVVPALPRWQVFLSKLAHLLLYAVMLVMPIAGWLILSAEGKEIPFGLPALISVNDILAHDIEAFHKLVGKIGYVLIALHVMAVIYHHVVRKDNVLKRMLLFKN
jgi:cytochrome b561